jgi:hypothetical protein
LLFQVGLPLVTLNLETRTLPKSSLRLLIGKAEAGRPIVEDDSIRLFQPLSEKDGKGEKGLTEWDIIGNVVVKDEEARGLCLDPLMEIPHP